MASIFRGQGLSVIGLIGLFSALYFGAIPRATAQPSVTAFAFAAVSFYIVLCRHWGTIGLATASLISITACC
jgi:hypothetical protein